MDWLQHTLRVALASCVLVAAGAAQAASAAVDQARRLGDSDPLAALAILEQGHEAGDAEASAALANTLFIAAPPRGNRARACAIARQLAEAGRGDGWALLASCMLAAPMPVADRLDGARTSARRAIALGSAQGGLVLYAAFVEDPRYATEGADGRRDERKAAALAALPVAQRGIQAEAWSGLSLALEQKMPQAAEFALEALLDTAAPGNLQRALDVAERTPTTARRLRETLAQAKEFQSLGGTHAAAYQLPAVLRAAQSAAALGLWRDGGAGCDSLALTKTAPSPPDDDAAYLPVRLGPLARAYLVSGRWRERWTFFGCNREVPVDIAFVADGLGGATFEATAAARSVVRRAP